MLASVVALAASGPPASAAPGVVLRQEAAGFAVEGPSYRAVISPRRGGRIVSYLFDGVEMTGLDERGRGGLIEGVHSADRAFDVVAQKVTTEGASLILQADVGPLRIVKRYDFPADRPWFSVGLAFHNRSPFRLAGGSAPALTNTIAGSGSPGRLYCLDAGRGAECLSPERLLARLPAGGGEALRWIAACEPAERRVLGFALRHGGARLLPAERAAGGTRFGWSYPDIPAGQTMRTELLVAPLTGLAALGELNRHFAADSVVSPEAFPLAVDLQVLPLAEAVRQVSVVTRAYGAEGAELAPCDAVLFDRLEPLRLHAARTRWSGREGRPDWVVHEVYGEGRLMGRFAVPLAGDASPPPAAPEPPAAPDLGPTPGYTLPPPGGLIRPAEAEQAFLLWRFDGQPARREAEAIELHLAAGQRRTAFLGLRALRPLRDLRLTVAATGADEAGRRPIPPAAIYLWHVRDAADGAAELTPLGELDLEAGQVAWLALTAEAAQLRAGHYGALLVADADEQVRRVPVALRVLDVEAAAGRGFGLWYLAEQPAALDDVAWSKLHGYGVSAPTVPVETLGRPPAASGSAESLGRLQPDLLSFAPPGGASPPSGPFGGRLLLPWSQPVWLLHSGAASPASLAAATEAGYAPALLCDGLDTVPEGLQTGPTGPAFYLVRDGCEQGAAAAMIQTGRMTGSESVWLYLDLRGADWRRAAVEVRSACWAAAWQRLAGLAVHCDAPRRAVDRQLALWHILRDTRAEVALWRQAVAAVAMQPDTPQDRPRKLRQLATLENIVGTTAHCELRAEAERRPFRRVFRIASPEGGEPRLGQFEAARREVLSVLASAPAAQTVERHLHWQGRPLTDGEGGVLCAIVAGEGEEAWQAALAFQRALQALLGKTVPLARAFPEPAADGPDLIWVVGRGSERQDWPEAVGQAVARGEGAPLAMAELPDGRLVAVLDRETDLQALMRTFGTGPQVFPPARQVR
jgi:hypothetical protein